jgi:Tfp pilus assembly protein FimT
MKNIQKFIAFTFAEVLITLSIIGVVLALTIPIVVNNYNEHKNVVKLKKTYSDLSAAYTSALNEKGSSLSYVSNIVGTLGWYDVATHQTSRDYFADYLKILDKNNVKYNDVEYYNVFNKTSITVLSDGNSYASLKGADGTLYFFRYGLMSDYAGNCINILVIFGNTKGKRLKAGRDVFLFHVIDSKNKIVPAGYFEMQKQAISSCYANSIFCTAWVIYNENMDYLHCNDLNWTDKTKCKF